MRVACYVDGFNLYHAIDDLGQPHLKWVDLLALGKSICRADEDLVKIAYFSAYATWLPEQYARHRQYVAALKYLGVECHIARFSANDAQCKKCKTKWVRHEEKETDVHFSLTLFEDAVDDVFDRAIIISADGDHAPAIRRVRKRYPAKQMFLAAPPNRHTRARELREVCGSSTMITQGRVAKCLLPEFVTDDSGKVIAQRPAKYDPPNGWHPPQ